MTVRIQIRMAKDKSARNSEELRGWQEIAEFLGQPVSVAQRWGRSGMPVRRSGRLITTTRSELSGWLAQESGGEPVEITTAETDLSAALKRGLGYVRKHRQTK